MLGLLGAEGWEFAGVRARAFVLKRQLPTLTQMTDRAGATPYLLLKFIEIVGGHINGHNGALKRIRTRASPKPLASRERA